MRIISGTSKGKKLYEPKDLLTRPLKDLTKESIFNIITHSNKFCVALEGANILDLFSGTGSFGLEWVETGAWGGLSLTFIVAFFALIFCHLQHNLMQHRLPYINFSNYIHLLLNNKFLALQILKLFVLMLLCPYKIDRYE